MQHMNENGRTAPLPTRVNRACKRCRRNKSRCDAYRPCSLCLRANAECINDDLVAEKAVSTSVPRLPLTEADGDGRISPLHKRRRIETAASPGSATTTSWYSRTRSRLSRSPSPHSPLEPVDSHDGEAAITIARNIHRLESQHIDNHAINAIPGADVGNGPFERGSPSLASKAPCSVFLKHPLPEESVMITLVEEYFESIHWFSVVILESKFRPSFNSIRAGMADPSEKPFLLLLSTMLGLASWYRGHVLRAKDGYSPDFWRDWSLKLLANSESQIIEILNQNSIIAVQTLILLGSFYVYHGRPNLSFALLGATVKAAQAARLHRESTHGTHEDREERKRVWWTIYTWDRFASITYGRPLGINDKDCNIGQPDDVLEDTNFSEHSNTYGKDPICFSAYQRELNKLYLIASPAIENIYNLPQSEHQQVAVENLHRVREVTLQLWTWRGRLPEHLFPRLDGDCSGSLSPAAKASCLQSLSLQLTFDSLIIVLHRPFIKQRLDLMLTSPTGQAPAAVGSQVTNINQPEFPQSSAPKSSDGSDEADITSHQQWWEAAIRTSRVTGLPQLAQFATDSHLVAFLGINLFNAAMVMVVVALSDPLTDKAQEAKRAVARIYRLQETLGTRSTLSQQSSSVLRSLVQLLLKRETDAILAPTIESDTQPSRRMSVRDALSVPLGQDLGGGDLPISSQLNKGLGLASRLNHSLATVQKAFTVGSDGDLSVATPLQSSRATSEGFSQTYNLNAYGAKETDNHQSMPTSDWVAGNVIGDSGLYWFWDPTWDELYTDLSIQQT